MKRTQRGAAIFIVMLVITVLAAIGIFAMRSASSVTTAAGYNRQAMQTLYLTELALQTGNGQINRAPKTYIDLIRTSVNEECMTNAAITNPEQQLGPAYAGRNFADCARIFSPDIATEVAALGGGPLLDQQAPAQSGSFGPPLIAGVTATETGAGKLNMEQEGLFILELTEAVQGPPVPGFSANSERTFCTYVITITSYGQLRNAAAVSAGPAWCEDATVSASASMLGVRSHVMTVAPCD